VRKGLRFLGWSAFWVVVLVLALVPVSVKIHRPELKVSEIEVDGHLIPLAAHEWVLQMSSDIAKLERQLDDVEAKLRAAGAPKRD
jgi:hypothetical protein